MYDHQHLDKVQKLTTLNDHSSAVASAGFNGVLDARIQEQILDFRYNQADHPMKVPDRIPDTSVEESKIPEKSLLILVFFNAT